MTDGILRILLVADTHLGIDMPFQPRVHKQRRGPDFFANFERALEPALCGQADLVVHGGDLFYRSKVPPALVEMAMAPLRNVANQGVPVFIVPGNHERSRIPLHLWTSHPNIYIFDKPTTFLVKVSDTIIALSGFPFARKVRDKFMGLVEQTGFKNVEADLRFLCIHQAVEGSQVGPSDYTFRDGPDVLRGMCIPNGFIAVLTGHIHRAQTLTHDLKGREIAAAVIYPGSIERTSFAERHEEKAYVMLRVERSKNMIWKLAEVLFMPLPTRPMIYLDISSEALNQTDLDRYIQKRLYSLESNSIVRVRILGSKSKENKRMLSAKHLRELAPEEMVISLVPERPRFKNRP